MSLGRSTAAMRAIAGGGIMAASLAAVPAQAAVTFFDGTFARGDVFTVVYNNAQPVSSGTGAASGQTSAGNPTPAYEVDFTYGPQPGGADILSTSLERTFVYDPGLSGAIRSIDVSLDRYLTFVQDGLPRDVATLTLRPLIEQDGLLYEAIFTDPANDPAGGVWQSLARGGLTASDFGLFDRNSFDAPDYTQHPDFAGGEITFGFGMRLNGGGSPILRSADGVLRADNFALTVNPVPEPATWSLMIAGFGLVGASLRRRTALPA